MQSKKSYFNRTLFRKNLTRYWPLWGGLSFVGAFVPLFMALQLATQSHRNNSPEDLAEILYNSVTMFAPAFIMGFAIICAMLIWNYLYSPRAVGLMHTLPVSRTCLFLTNTVSGLTIMAIPFAVVGALITLVSMLFGMFHPIAVVQTVVAVVFLAVLFFGMATLCAMLTGHAAMLPVLYLLLNFLAEIVEVMVSYLSSLFLMGVPAATEGRLIALTPVLNIYAKFRAKTEQVYYGTNTFSQVDDWDWKTTLTGLGTVALYALVGLAMLALAWVLYRKRQSERAGDVAAFRPLRPVFRYGAALLSALTLGQLLEQLFFEALYTDVYFSDFVPMIVCMSIAGVFGYYVASMILEKSLRVFKGSWKGILTVCAAVVILCVGVSMDLLGLENKVPDLDDIAQIIMYGPMDSINIDTSTEEGRMLAEQVVDIHRAILADKEYIYSISERLRRHRYSYSMDEDDRSMATSLTIYYTLEDGSTMRRYYSGIPFTEARMKDPNTYDGKVYQLTHREEIMTQQVRVPDGSLMRINVYAEGWDLEGSGDYQRLYDALLQDAKEGHVSSIDFPYWEYEDRSETKRYVNCWVEILYNVVRDGVSDTGTKGVDVFSDMTHTIDVLIADGYLTREQMDSLAHGESISEELERQQMERLG